MVTPVLPSSLQEEKTVMPRTSYNVTPFGGQTVVNHMAIQKERIYLCYKTRTITHISHNFAHISHNFAHISHNLHTKHVCLIAQSPCAPVGSGKLNVHHGTVTTAATPKIEKYDRRLGAMKSPLGQIVLDALRNPV